jgi:hypothetical protein
MGTQALHPAIEFLQHLDPSDDAVFNLQHHTDLPSGEERPEPDPLLGLYSGLNISAVEKLLPTLHAFNERGAGIFVARNQCAGNRSEKNVVRVRGIHADMDDVSEIQLSDLMTALPPSIVVESSAGRYQLYWQLAEGQTLSKEEAKAINQCLSREYGADPAAVDVARLLRLPGFKHMKYRSHTND